MASAPLPPGGSPRLGLPLVLGLVVLVVAVVWGVELRSREKDALESASQATLVSVASELDRRMEGQTGALVRLAARWEGSEGAAGERWQADVRWLLEHFPSFQAIECSNDGLFLVSRS